MSAGKVIINIKYYKINKVKLYQRGRYHGHYSCQNKFCSSQIQPVIEKGKHLSQRYKIVNVNFGNEINIGRLLFYEDLEIR